MPWPGVRMNAVSPPTAAVWLKLTLLRRHCRRSPRTGRRRARRHHRAARAAAAIRDRIHDVQIFERDLAGIDEQSMAEILAVERRIMSLDVERHARLQVDGVESAAAGYIDGAACGNVDLELAVVRGHKGGLRQHVVQFHERRDGDVPVRRENADIRHHVDDGRDAVGCTVPAELAAVMVNVVGVLAPLAPRAGLKTSPCNSDRMSQGFPSACRRRCWR